MAITFVGASSASNGVSPVTLTLPASEDNDLGLIFLTRGSTTDQPIPSGWTQIGSAQQKSNGMTTLAVCRVLKPSDSGATLSLHLDVGDGNAGAAVATCAVYRGADTSTPIDAFAGHTDPTGATAATHATASVTVTTDQAWIVDSVAVRPATSTAEITTPAGRTQRATSPLQAGNFAIVADSAAGVATGATSAATYTTPASEQGVLWSVALKPGTVVPPTPGTSRYQLQDNALAPIVGYRLASGVLA